MALLYAPAADWHVYGSSSHCLQYGGIARMETVNQNSVLPPIRSKQAEFDVKRNVNQQLVLSGTVFEMRQGLEYTNASAGGDEYGHSRAGR